MNVFKALYCNQYYELKPKGKANEARNYGTRLLIVSTALNIIVLVILLMFISEDFTDWFSDTLRDIFGRSQSRTVGRVVAIIPFIIAFPLVRFTLGRQEVYDKLIAEFTSLSDREQLCISKRGFYYFIASLIAFFIALVLGSIYLT